MEEFNQWCNVQIDAHLRQRARDDDFLFSLGNDHSLDNILNVCRERIMYQPAKTRLQIIKDKERLQKQMEELDKEIKAIDPDPVREIAHAIHRTMCHKKHDDDCAFYYDNWDNSSGTRQIYVKQAVEMLKVCKKEHVLLILDIIDNNRSY